MIPLDTAGKSLTVMRVFPLPCMAKRLRPRPHPADSPPVNCPFSAPCRYHGVMEGGGGLLHEGNGRIAQTWGIP